MRFLSYLVSMARPLRIEYPDAWHHVTSRGNERRDIFKDDSDRTRFLAILANSSNLYGAEVHAYVLMDNHFHLVVMTHEANLSKFMQRFNTSYTVYFNRRHRRSGHLYQGRYKALLIDADNYLLELSRYVHLNPVRIKRYSRLNVKEKRKIMRKYRWSSYDGYKRMKDRQPFVNYFKILKMVGGKDDQEGRDRYERFVMSGISKEMQIPFWEGVRGQAILGSENFVDWIKEHFLSNRKEDRRELPGLKALERGPVNMEEIAREVASRFGIEKEGLYRRYASCLGARSVFMELCILYLSRSISFSEIGRKLGNVSVPALSQNRRRLAAKMENDAELKKRFEELKKLCDTNHELSTVKV